MTVEECIQDVIKEHTRVMDTLMNHKEVHGVLIMTDIDGAGSFTSGAGTTTTAKTPAMMKDDAVDIICQKHCCAVQPFSETCKHCPLYEFIKYQESKA